ncbi:hypothetical protein ABL78_6295 [Leptomonas seymouri]|uniref:Uncharacterized protein n=1 Tax=Leptomonas seymouri TaxID=5684 RepID=A0A0N1PAY3_LEPSE|nr:hypothetical protein ABL78_6295 [Leptomonas seymouri]|eukprot:KPI84654.1 hypothetical protein ABL78_6295 [Leptomonas seymouri]
MSSEEAIVKRRPSRPQVHPELQDEAHAAEEQFEEEEHLYEVGHHNEAAEETALLRKTCNQSDDSDAAYHVEPDVESEDENNRSAPFTEEEAAAAHDGHAAAAAAPPLSHLNAMPQFDAKAQKTKRARSAKKEAGVSPIAAAKPAAPKKKKPVHRVNLANVEKQPPVPEGVNTPRSIAVCEQHGVNPSELAPYPKERFQGAGVANEVAELRYHSYEKRRQARMAELKPAYRIALQAQRAQEAEKEEEAGEAEEEQRPTVQSTDEDDKMRRQFEAQHQRLLEQERRKASDSGGYGNDGYRRVSAHASYPRGTSPGRYSTSSAGLGRPTVDQPYSAVKIYSHCISEERQLTQSEAVMIENIHDREARRLDAQERAAIIQENRQLLYVEQELKKERVASANVQAKAHERKRLQQEHFLHSKDRYYEAAARRQILEVQRQAKLMESIAQKSNRTNTSEPFASLLSRHRSSSARRGSGNASAQQGEQSAEEHKVETEVR